MVNVIKNVRVLKKFETNRVGTSISVGYGTFRYFLNIFKRNNI